MSDRPIVNCHMAGRQVSATPGQTILEAARENGMEIPTLCHLDGLSDVGACRMCLVEVAGRGKLMPACTTLVEDGLDVTLENARLLKYRKMILEFFFAERNHVCAVCVSNGNCELQSQAERHGITHLHMPYRHPRLTVDASHERFILDHNRCILCTRCVRVCDEVEGAHTWDVLGRGIDGRVVIDLNQPWGDSQTCTSCGKCVEVCPTGALVEKGQAVGEMKKHPDFLPQLLHMREAHQHD